MAGIKDTWKNLRFPSFKKARDTYRNLTGKTPNNQIHTLNSVNDISGMGFLYDLFILSSHSIMEASNDTIGVISPKTELISVSDYDTFLMHCGLAGKLMPVNKAVMLEHGEDNHPYILRFQDGKMNVLDYTPGSGAIKDKTDYHLSTVDIPLEKQITHHYDTPDMVVKAVIDMHANLRGKMPKTLFASKSLSLESKVLSDVDNVRIKEEEIDAILSGYMAEVSKPVYGQK